MRIKHLLVVLFFGTLFFFWISFSLSFEPECKVSILFPPLDERKRNFTSHPEETYRKSTIGVWGEVQRDRTTRDTTVTSKETRERIFKDIYNSGSWSDKSKYDTYSIEFMVRCLEDKLFDIRLF